LDYDKSVKEVVYRGFYSSKMNIPEVRLVHKGLSYGWKCHFFV